MWLSGQRPRCTLAIKNGMLYPARPDHQINNLRMVTKEVVETARESLVIGNV